MDYPFLMGAHFVEHIVFGFCEESQHHHAHTPHGLRRRVNMEFCVRFRTHSANAFA